MMKRLAATVTIVLGGLVAAGAASAGGGNQAAIDAIHRLRTVDSVRIVDTMALSDVGIQGKRARQPFTPATPLQQAIVDNPALMSEIRATAGYVFDLRSVYAARVDGYRVTIYLGEPPGP